MAPAPFDSRADSYADRAEPRERSVGEHIFIWIAWALAAAFWGATATTFMGILNAVSQPTPGASGGADVGGVGWLLTDVVGGLLLLGLAIAYGSWRYAHRNRGLDPASDAGTAALYNTIERQGGEDMTCRSPDPDRRMRDFR